MFNIRENRKWQKSRHSPLWNGKQTKIKQDQGEHMREQALGVTRNARYVSQSGVLEMLDMYHKRRQSNHYWNRQLTATPPMRLIHSLRHTLLVDCTHFEDGERTPVKVMQHRCWSSGRPTVKQSLLFFAAIIFVFKCPGPDIEKRSMTDIRKLFELPVPIIILPFTWMY